MARRHLSPKKLAMWKFPHRSIQQQVPKEIHARTVTAAAAKGMSLNQFVQDAIMEAAV